MYIAPLHCIYSAPSRILAFWLMLSVLRTTLNKAFLSYLILSYLTLHHKIIMFNFTWNYLIIIYIYYYHTYIMQISIYVINNMPEPGRNLAADACMGRTLLSPCIISVPGQSVPTGMPGQECHVSMTFFSCWATYIQIFFGNIYNIVTTTVTNSTGAEPVSYIILLNQLAVKITRPRLNLDLTLARRK